MKKIFFLILTISTIQFFAQKTPKMYQDTLIWREGLVLKKEDFKAKPKSNIPIQTGTSMVMFTKDAGGTIIFVVQSVFYRNMSFMKAGLEYTLKHEQNNFDLCELYARQLRKKIATKNFNKSKNVRQDLTDMYNDCNNDYYKERTKYEKETEFGLNVAKQQAWNDRIVKELAELSAYSSTDVQVMTK
jgi:hypothetical protein